MWDHHQQKSPKLTWVYSDLQKLHKAITNWMPDNCVSLLRKVECSISRKMVLLVPFCLSDFYLYFLFFSLLLFMVFRGYILFTEFLAMTLLLSRKLPKISWDSILLTSFTTAVVFRILLINLEKIVWSMLVANQLKKISQK